MDQPTSTVSAPQPVARQPARPDIAERVVDAVAEAVDTSPLALDPPLYTAVDPEALDAVVGSMDDASADPVGTVAFTYCDCDVTVTADGLVDVAPADRTD